MSEPRLATEFWVHAYLRRLRNIEIPAFVTSKGDKTAGAVLIKLNTLDGSAKLFQRSFDLMSGERAWVVLSDGDEATVDHTIERQKSFDPDIWVIEVEDRAGRHLLEQSGLV